MSILSFVSLLLGAVALSSVAADDSTRCHDKDTITFLQTEVQLNHKLDGPLDVIKNLLGSGVSDAFVVNGLTTMDDTLKAGKVRLDHFLQGIESPITKLENTTSKCSGIPMVKAALLSASQAVDIMVVLLTDLNATMGGTLKTLDQVFNIIGAYFSTGQIDLDFLDPIVTTITQAKNALERGSSLESTSAAIDAAIQEAIDVFKQLDSVMPKLTTLKTALQGLLSKAQNFVSQWITEFLPNSQKAGEITGAVANIEADLIGLLDAPVTMVTGLAPRLEQILMSLKGGCGMPGAAAQNAAGELRCISSPVAAVALAAVVSAMA